MLRFFLGLSLVQLVIAVLVQFSPLSSSLEKALLTAFVIILMSTVVTLWFNTIARHQADKRIAVLKERFASEREKLNVNAEKEQKKLLKKTQKEIETERRKQSTRANLKIGGTIAVAAGFGVIMLMSQFFTLGLLSLTTAGGAIGGYLARSRKDQLDGPEYKMLEGVEVIDEKQKRLTSHDNEITTVAVDTTRSNTNPNNNPNNKDSTADQ